MTRIPQCIESRQYKDYYLIPLIPCYVISVDGEVKDVETGHILKAGNSHLYFRVWLSKMQRDYQVHQLVCMAFWGLPPEGKTFVNHMDTVKINNHYTNLEWASHSENIKHAWDNNLIVRKNVPMSISSLNL